MSAEAGYSDTGRQMLLPIVDPVEGTRQDIKVTCDFHLTDLGNALRLVADCGANIRYSPIQNTWYIWNGVSWVADTTNRIKEIAKQRVKLIHAEAAFVDRADKKDQKAKQKEIENWAFKSESEYRIVAMIALAESDDRIVVEPHELNRDPNLLNCLNGTIDFENCPRDNPVREHRREDLITKVCPIRYNPDAKGQLWYDTLFGALPAGVVFFLQDAFGYSCIFTMEEKAFLFLYGIPDGRKSSVLDPAFSVLGDYAHAFHYSTFMKKGVRANSARPDIIDMEGLRAAQCSELPKGFVIDDALIKSLTSANPQHVRNLYDRHMHDVTVKATFWFESNFMAKIDFEDQANFNRLNVIVFNRPLENVDKSVLEKLMTDAEEREAIFAWIVDGAYEWREHGLQRPAEVNAATKEYQRTMNPLTWFIDGHCEKKDGVKIGASELHKRFKSIAETMPREFQRTIQAEMLSVANFGRTMKKLGFVSKHTESGSVYEGLTIPDTWEEIEYEIDPYMEQIVRPDRADGYEANLDKTHVENLSAYRSLRKTLSNPSALSAELPTANLWDLDAPPDSLSDVQIEPHPTRIIRQADFEGYVREKLEGLADGDLKGSFAPELLCKITVADYCDEHEISGDDRKSRINLSRHFSELVNGKSSAASIFLNLTGGRPLLLAGNRS